MADRAEPTASAAIAAVADRIDVVGEGIDAIADADLAAASRMVMSELQALGERVLEIWVETRGEPPTAELKEGFRLLALHRQGARGEPSFNACRETTRELAYHVNLIAADPVHPDTRQRLRLAAMVARHLALFVGGKIEVAGLGDFCCSSRPVRSGEA